MIFYFSGTGNSLWAATRLSKAFGGALISIADELKKDAESLSYPLAADEKVFFVFPVHSWGPAVLVPRFISKMNLQNYTSQAVYSICVCGDNCGYTDKIMQKNLSRKKIRLAKSYSIQMPNNYILMKGFGVDSKETEAEKLAAAPDAVNEIIRDIELDENKNLYETGRHPFVKSSIVYPSFCKFVVGRNKFYAADTCISCRQCVEVCPVGTVSMDDSNKPIWNGGCVQCTACIHRCPVQAIEYGNITQNQGRYHHPDLL